MNDAKTLTFRRKVVCNELMVQFMHHFAYIHICRMISDRNVEKNNILRSERMRIISIVYYFGSH